MIGKTKANYDAIQNEYLKMHIINVNTEEETPEEDIHVFKKFLGTDLVWSSKQRKKSERDLFGK